MMGEEQPLVPRLRFPEFRDAGEWEYKELAPFLESYSEKVAASENEFPVYSSTREGLKFQRDYYDGRELVNEGEYGIVPKDYFVYRHMSDDTTFKFNLNDTGGKIAVSKEYPVFKTTDLNSKFLLHKLNGGLDFKKFAESQRKGGTRTRLYFKTLCSWRSLLPGLKEQQKISDCLSSLDALILAQAEKIDILKTHKKGLMQELFPREGEMVPRLRFSEFRGAGEWKEKQLSECCHLQAGKFVRASDIYEQRADDRYPCFGGNGLRGYTQTFTHSGQYPLIGRQGAQCGNINLASGKFHATEHAVVAAANQGVNALWLSYMLTKMNLNQYATGQAQPGLSVENMDKLVVMIPDRLEEQQVIADSLLSLDALITDQEGKLDAFKTHKKGLMQQLFPNPEAASA